MIDIVAQIKINRIERDIENISGSVASVVSAAAAGVGVVDNYLTLRAATTITLTHPTIALRLDINGNSGLFSYDSTSTAADDGANVIVDLAGRRWVRWGSLV